MIPLNHILVEQMQQIKQQAQQLMQQFQFSTTLTIILATQLQTFDPKDKEFYLKRKCLYVK